MGGAGPEAAGRGVYRVPHVYTDGTRLIYAADSLGVIIGEMRVSPEVEGEAAADLEALLDRLDPVGAVRPRRAMRLVR